MRYVNSERITEKKRAIITNLIIDGHMELKKHDKLRDWIFGDHELPNSCRIHLKILHLMVVNKDVIHDRS